MQQNSVRDIQVNYETVSELVPIKVRTRFELRDELIPMENSIKVSSEMIEKVKERGIQPNEKLLHEDIEVDVPQDMQNLIGDDLPEVELPTKRKRENGNTEHKNKQLKNFRKEKIKKAMENPVHGPRFRADTELNSKHKSKKKAEKLSLAAIIPSETLPKPSDKYSSDADLKSLIKTSPQINSTKNSSKSKSSQLKPEVKSQSFTFKLKDEFMKEDLVPIPKKKK